MNDRNTIEELQGKEHSTNVAQTECNPFVLNSKLCMFVTVYYTKKKKLTSPKSSIKVTEIRIAPQVETRLSRKIGSV